ncbi:hypothetical protein D3C84_1209600 [compost metagenome]
MTLARKSDRLTRADIELPPVNGAGDQVVFDITVGQRSGGMSACIRRGVERTVQVIDTDITCFRVYYFSLLAWR